MERFKPRVDPRPVDRAWPAMVWPPTAQVLTGETVELKPTQPVQDAPELFAALVGERVWAHLPLRPVDPDELATVLTAQQASGWWGWIVRSRSTGEVLGTTSYLDVSQHDARLEIGFTAYAAPHWGGRVNPETKLLLLRYAFEVLHVGRVQLKTDVRNVRSQQAIYRLGATYEGVLRRYQRRTDGSVRDTVLFSISAEEWPAVEAGLLARLARLAG